MLIRLLRKKRANVIIEHGIVLVLSIFLVVLLGVFALKIILWLLNFDISSIFEGDPA